MHPRSLFAVAVVEDGRKSLSPTRAIVKIVERKQSCRTMGWNGKGCWWRRMSRLSTVSQSFDLATGYTPLCSYLLFIYFFSPTPTPSHSGRSMQFSIKLRHLMVLMFVCFSYSYAVRSLSCTPSSHAIFLKKFNRGRRRGRP